MDQRQTHSRTSIRQFQKSIFFSHATCNNGDELSEQAATKFAAEGTVQWTAYLLSVKYGMHLALQHTQ